ncbi:MAG: hypothetical protein RLZZ157_641 [Pseudomonadota bacterium]|jgi:hypothetical protein
MGTIEFGQWKVSHPKHKGMAGAWQSVRLLARELREVGQVLNLNQKRFWINRVGKSRPHLFGNKKVGKLALCKCL